MQDQTKKSPKIESRQKNKDLLFDNSSKMSSDMNNFNIHELREKKESSFFSGNMGKTIQDMELSD